MTTVAASAGATATGAPDSGGGSDGAAGSPQLRLFQAVTQHPDNIFPYTQHLPVHNVPSPASSTEPAGGRARPSYQDQLAAHLGASAKSSLYTLSSQPDVCVQWRVLADGRSLELRPLRWIATDAAATAAGGGQPTPGGESAACNTSTWRFDSPILANVVMFDEADTHGNAAVTVTACSRSGVVYRLHFSSVWDISSPSVDVRACTGWYQIKWCAEGRADAGRRPLLIDGVGPDTLAVGFEDAALVWLQWKLLPSKAHGDLQDYAAEKVSSPSGIMQSVRDFIPRILRRGASAQGDDGNAHSRLVSFAATQVLDGSVQYAVTLNRDRRLRFWCSSTGSACQHEEVLPQLDLLGTPIPANPHAAPPPPLADRAQSYVHIVAHSTSVLSHDTEIETSRENVFGVLVFVPDEATPYFTLLQVAIDVHGRIASVQTIMYKACRAANGASQLMADDELVDFQLTYHDALASALVEGPNGHLVEEEVSSPYWTLWALWDRAQEPVLTYTYFSLRPSASGAAGRGLRFEGHPVLGERWYTVLSPHQAMRPSGDGSQIKEVEARLAYGGPPAPPNADGANAAGGLDSEADQPDDAGAAGGAVQVAEISKAFLDHLFHPVRFDRGVLEHALCLYEASARDRGFDFPAMPYAVTSSGPHLWRRIEAVVGSFLRVETSRETGEMLVDDYHRALFTEWMRYSTLCARLQRTANSPKSLSVCRATHMVCIVGSASLSVLQSAGEIEWMHALAQHDAAAAVLLSAPECALAERFPGLAPLDARAEVSKLLAASSYLVAAMPAYKLLQFTGEMASEASGEMLVSYEARATELFEKHAAGAIEPHHVRRVVRMLGRCRAPGDTLLQLLQALAQSADGAAAVTLEDAPQSFRASASMDGLFAAGFAVSANAHFELARDIVLMLVCIAYHCDRAGSVDLGNIPAMLATGTGVFNLYAVAQLVASQSIGTYSDEHYVEDAAAADGFLSRFSVLNINKRGDSACGEDPAGGDALVYSLLHEMLRRHYRLRFTGRTGVFADMLAEGVEQVYANLDLRVAGPGCPQQPSLVAFAAKLERTVPPELTEAFLRLVAKGTASSYLNGLVLLRMRDFAGAADALASAGAAYAQVGEGVRAGVDLQHVLPADVLESGHAHRYYEHVAELFEAAKHYPSVSRFSHRALELLQDEAGQRDAGVDAGAAAESQQRLWLKIFHAELECDAHEEAYVAMMANPDQRQQLDCLRHLVGVLCEQAGGVAILCRLSFIGLQEEVERNLLFKAHHGDPLATPSYYKILYSFHVYRGNYRNAASAMYQYARRLAAVLRSSSGCDVERLLAEQSQALLACANGLSIVDRQYTWVVVGRQAGAATADEAAGLDGGAKRKRRRIAIGRFDASSSSQGQDIDIVELADVQREYALCMARLTLGASFQELFSRSVLLEPEDAVALYVRLGMYDSALALAKAFGLKLDYIFSSLAQRCLELSVATSGRAQQEQTPEAFWQNRGVQEVAGPPSERAWRLMQYYLDLEEPGACSQPHYRLLVADAVLRSEHDAVLAPWLSAPLLQHCPQDLVRLCLRNGCVSEGGEFLLQHINALCGRIAAADTAAAEARKTCEFWMPYQLLDQTTGILDDAVARFEDAVAKIRRARKQGGPAADKARLGALLRGYADRLAGLQRLRSDLRASIDRYMALAARDMADGMPVEPTAAAA
ncbi:hypothetical protein IWQ56_001615 [Coemansia nantahalensis]|nr:hypothetical protein IWQ56_001615 [Coemansia nantahalensis]